MGWRCEHDLRLAASFLRSVETESPKTNLELQELATRIDDIAGHRLVSREQRFREKIGKLRRPVAI